MAGPSYENKWTLGNILTIVTMAVGGIWFAAGSQANLQAQNEKIRALELISQAADGRIRAVEIGQASQSSDLRNIQNTLNEIKEGLDRLAKAP
jgi:hypothetical protein